MFWGFVCKNFCTHSMCGCVCAVCVSVNYRFSACVCLIPGQYVNCELLLGPFLISQRGVSDEAVASVVR